MSSFSASFALNMKFVLADDSEMIARDDSEMIARNRESKVNVAAE